MKKKKKSFSINKKQLSELLDFLIEGDSIPKSVKALQEYLPQDIAEVLEHVPYERFVEIFLAFPIEEGAKIMVELKEELQEDLLDELVENKNFWDYLEYLNTDDAVDLLKIIPNKFRDEILNKLQETDKAESLINMLKYKEDTAGALMEKEMIIVEEDWSVSKCVKYIRKVSEKVEKIHAIYVINKRKKLVGLVSVKKLIISPVRELIKNIINYDVIKVNENENATEVVYLMKKYDLVVLPVVDSLNRLVGRTTIDDVVDYMSDEAERDYQIASGLTVDTDLDDHTFLQVKSRLPWLLIGMVGGMSSAYIMGTFNDILDQIPIIITFVPLIMATGGNVGVQSSALMIQWINNQKLNLRILNKIKKEVFTSLLIALLLSGSVIVLGRILSTPFSVVIAVSVAMLIVIIISAFMGCLIPYILQKLKIDPAIGTGPFITTTNDILGTIIYFNIVKLLSVYI